MSDKLLCTYCGTYNDAEATHCVRCGHELERIVLTRGDAAQDDAADSGSADDGIPQDDTADLLQALMEEPVTKIPDEPAAAKKVPADKTFTQVFTRTELDAAIAASEARKQAETAAREAQKEKLIEESLRYLEQEKRDREEQRLEKLRRQKEEELYAEFEEPAAKPQPAPQKQKRRGWIPVVVILLLLLLAAGGFFGWRYFFNQTSVNLTHNIASQDIQIQGKDGEAEVIIDEELFRSRADYPRGNEKAEEFMQTVSYMVEPSSGLSNGDTVTVRAIYSEETAKALHIDVKGAEKTFEIGGMEEKKTFNWDPLGLFSDDEKASDDNAAAAEETSSLISEQTLIPEIDSRNYTDSDVAGKDAAYIQAMVNELYARHGYIFKDKTLQKAYEAQSWYKGTQSDMGKVEQSFNTYEKNNLSFLTNKAGQ